MSDQTDVLAAGAAMHYEYLPDAELSAMLRALAHTTAVVVGARTEHERVAILLGAARRIEQIGGAK